jgi:hypothetical protein
MNPRETIGREQPAVNSGDFAESVKGMELDRRNAELAEMGLVPGAVVAVNRNEKVNAPARTEWNWKVEGADAEHPGYVVVFRPDINNPGTELAKSVPAEELLDIQPNFPNLTVVESPDLPVAEGSAPWKVVNKPGNKNRLILVSVNAEDPTKSEFKAMTPAELYAIKKGRFLTTDSDGGQVELATPRHMGRILNAETIAAEMTAEGGPEANNIAELAWQLPPTTSHECGGYIFNLSNVVREPNGGREFCVGYVTDEDQDVTPRLYYRSQSEGEWRITPVIEPGGRFSKGEKFESGYVRETRLIDSLRSVLEEKAKTGVEVPKDTSRWMRDHFKQQALGKRGYERYLDTADAAAAKFPEMFMKFKPGHGFETGPAEPPAREQLAQLEVPERYAPDFSKPLEIIKSQHPILGEVTTESVCDNSGSLAWRFSYDGAGRVWVSGVSDVKELANSYGTDEKVVLGGVLDNKPLEYDTQVGGLESDQNHRDYELLPGGGHYVDITPLLDNLKVIQQFRAARGIQRQAA